MERIEITNQKEIEGARVFTVGIGGLNYLVTVDNDYWRQLTDGKCSAEDLVKWSFKFLLDREPKETILRQFNLRQIQNYFPEYESKIKSYI